MLKNRVGESRLNNAGKSMTIIAYRGTNDMDVRFEDGFVRKSVSYSCFKRGAVDAEDYSKRIGEHIYNSAGTRVEIIDYKNSNNVTVRFDNGFIAENIFYSNFKRKIILSPYCKTVFGVGYLGGKEYTFRDKWYKHWHSMLNRVHNPQEHYRGRYNDVTICEEWYNYQTFAKWCENNYYEIENLTMNLDKDILLKGNKLYSPQTCVFVPVRINSLFIKCDASRGDLPIGVYWHERDQEYRAQCSYIDVETGKRKNKWLGGHDNPNGAFIAYKSFKENHIKYLANYYKECIPENLYNVMINYEVEITD